MPLSPGQILNRRYRIDKILGQGGFGAVYQAWDLNLERACALKENLQATPESQRQFKREALMLADLAHLNLPRVIDHFVIEGQGQYLVMDFVAGEDLQSMLDRQGALSEAQALPWIGQICAALEYLHGQEPPVIHRDIKPANIRIRLDGRAMLVDFGIAKSSGPNQATTLGAKAITPGYSPPEQYGMGAPTDARSDVYALGATLYTLLTGQAPHDSVDVLTGCSPPPQPVRALAPGVSAEVSAAIERAMALKREERWRGVGEFRQALAPPAQAPAAQKTTAQVQVTKPPAAPAYVAPTMPVYVPGRSGEAPPESLPPRPFNRGLLLAGGLLGLALLAGALWLIGQWSYAAGRRSLDATATVQVAVVESGRTSAPLTPAAGISPTWTLAPPTRAALLLPTHTATMTLASATHTATSSPTAAPALLQPPTSAQAGDAWTRPADGMVMKYIPARSFEMGSADGRSDERPVHTVEVSAFWMDEHEVTNAMYALCVRAGACQKPEGDDYGNAQYDDHPVVNVDWEQASAYCAWAEARLPTEAEWEKAARGGLTGKKYPWGDEAPVCTPGATNGAQYNSCDGDTAPVKRFAPNGFGLYDMAGNVWEWVQDRYDSGYYAQSPAADPQGPYSGEGPESGAYRVLRGGSWGLHVSYLRSAYRSWVRPSTIVTSIGFRCSRSP